MCTMDFGGYACTLCVDVERGEEQEENWKISSKTEFLCEENFII